MSNLLFLSLLTLSLTTLAISLWQLDLALRPRPEPMEKVNDGAE